MGMFVVAPAASFHHHHNHDSSSLNLAAAGGDPNATALGVGVGVIPLLTATPCLSAQNMEDQDFMNTTTGRNNKISSNGIQFWQNQTHQFNHHNNNNTNRPNPSANNLLLPTGIGGNSASSSGGGGTATCQDCGNQAKKDCTHRRCRTCCKSRGYDCSTHVRSTWVPAARRRERQLMSTTGGGGGGGGGGACSSGSTSGAKKPRLINSQTTTSHTSTSNTNTPRSFDTSSSHQDHAGFNKEGLPGQVRAPAVFKCVRVTAVDDGEDEYAYQAMVKIGGHVFKGFLYDQGVFDQTRDQSNFPNFSELHLGNANSSDHGGGGGGIRNGGGASTSSPILDPAEVYASASAAAGGLLAAGHSAYGNPIN